MPKRAKKILVLLVITSLMGGMATPAFALDTQAYDPTEDGGNARLLGLGEAYTAISDDPNAVFVNPAGLGGVKSLSIMGMYYTRVFGTYYTLTGAGAVPTPYGTLGIGYVGTGVGGIPHTDSSSSLGEFENSDNVFLLSYGTSLGRFSRDWRRVFVGASAKVFSRGFTDPVSDSGFGFNFDLGVKYIPARWISLGFSKRNILPAASGGGIRWTTGHTEDLTSPTRFGVALRLLEGKSLTGIDIRMPSEAKKPTLLGIGTEYKLDESFSLRAGLSENIDAASPSRTVWDPSLGIGFHYDYLKIDYAYKPYFSDSSNATHYISLSFEEDLSKILNIKISKFDKEMFRKSSIYSIPGKVYDDLGNVVKGAETRYHPGQYWSPHLSALNSMVPVTAQVIDYDTLMAYAFTDIKFAEDKESARKYTAGELVPILVEAPYDIETIMAVMPNGDRVNLLYDGKAQAWYGIWRVPKGMKKGLYTAKIVASDFEGITVVSTSTPFFLEGEEVGGIGEPDVEGDLQAEAKAKAEADAKAEEDARAKAEAEERARKEAEER
ncbi:MAG: PorV/PorQ family protein, partial [Planctomycetota bacterium]